MSQCFKTKTKPHDEPLQQNCTSFGPVTEFPSILGCDQFLPCTLQFINACWIRKNTDAVSLKGRKQDSDTPWVKLGKARRYKSSLPKSEGCAECSIL